MSLLETVETLVGKIPCPVCMNSRFQVNLNCEVAKAPCDIHARCGHCNYKFLVTNDTKTMEDIWLRVEQHVVDKGCPECGDHKLHLEFLCDVKSENCFFLVRCGDRGHYSRLSPHGIRYLFG